MSKAPARDAVTFRVLIVEDNHSFIDTLKVMLRDLPLDFSHAYRYNDALAILEKDGIFYNRQDATAAETTPKKKSSVSTALYNENGIFLIIVEQNTETSMKGTDFVAHAIRKFPGLNESDFILLTHRLDAVPTRNYGFPVMEKPLRAPQIKQAVLQKIKQAQEFVEAQTRAAIMPPAEEHADGAKSTSKGLRHLLKIKRDTEAQAAHVAANPEKKVKADRSKAKKAAGGRRPKPK